MALTRKVRVSVYESRAFDLKSDRTAQQYTGFLNKGFLENGESIRFSSRSEMKAFDLGAFDPNNCVEITLYGKEFQNTVKWSTEKGFTGN